MLIKARSRPRRRRRRSVRAPASAQQVTKQTVPGVTNFAKLETTVACGGATTPEAVPELKKMGFASIINLRLPIGSRRQRRRRSRRREGRRHQLLQHPVQRPVAGSRRWPTSSSRRSPTPGNEPAYIHCAAGNRAGAMWMIKRLVVDHWDTDKAFTEATALGLTSPALKQFAIDYAQTHKR